MTDAPLIENIIGLLQFLRDDGGGVLPNSPGFAEAIERGFIRRVRTYGAHGSTFVDCEATDEGKKLLAKFRTMLRDWKWQE